MIVPVRDRLALWPAGFCIRPRADPARSGIEVVDMVTGRRFGWDADALSRFILQDGRLPPGGDRQQWATALRPLDRRAALVPGWEHWSRRGWHPSDQFYVASRRWHYVDGSDGDGSVRRSVIEHFLKADGPPPEEMFPPGPVSPLEPPAPPPARSIGDLLVKRRSERAYRQEPVPGDRLSGLLWYGFEEVRRHRRNTHPAIPLSYVEESFGSAWDVYLALYDVDGIEPGVFRYHVLDHGLIAVRPGNHRRAMIDVLQGMHSSSTAAWTLSLVADFPRYQWRYRHEHALRRLYVEAGLIAQPLIILGMAYGLGTLVTPAQRDRQFLELHGLSDDRYGPMYTLTMGWQRNRAATARRPQVGQ